MTDPLLADLRRIYSGDAWHGPAVLDVIRDLTAEQAAARPVREAHTIYELTHHISAWIEEVTSRVQGNKPGMPADGDFPPSTTKVDAAAWGDVCARLERHQVELLVALAAFDPARLDDAVDPKNKGKDGPVTFRALLSGLAQHSAYHAGQIMLL